MNEHSTEVNVFVPMDRRLALARGERLPERSSGAVLFADVSGFTPLTAALNERLGPERGAEELTKQMNQVFEVLIVQVHRYGGSVIIFSGDAITCWFEGDNGRRATACALALQGEMGQFEQLKAEDGGTFPLALKVAVVVGKANRFLVGHTHIQRLEALAGATLDRVAAAEQLLNQGETIVGAEVMAWFGEQLQVAEWRSDGRGEHFAVVAGMTAEVDPVPWLPISLDPQVGREWVMPPVAERVLRGEGEYLAQIRPSVALFLRFGGIDYDEDKEAGAKLDVYIRWVQTVLAEYEGYLLELTIGDKGSYLYCVFGTPLIHENDPARAISAAVDLQTPPPGMAFIGPVQIGISQGMMRAGAYGSRNRRSYGVQGQEVSIAARLMSQAEPGQILVSGRIVEATETLFEFESLGSVPLKGVQKPLPVYNVLGEKVEQGVLDSAKHTVAPLVGRERETAVFQEQLQGLKTRQGGTIIVEGEAGIGKSRLVAEFLHEAEEQAILSLVGAGIEVTQSTAYHAWRPIFQQLFGIRRDDDIEQAWERVMGWLGEDVADELLQRMPLLSVVLPFHIPDSALTVQLSGELRANNTTDLLITVLKKAAERNPLVLVLEDGHWLDVATWMLIERLKWETAPILLVIVMRPFRGLEVKEEIANHYERLLAAPDIRLLFLKPLSLEQTSRLVCHRLGVTALPDNVGELIHARAEGHPYFSEELAIAVRDMGLIQIRNGYCQLTTGLDELYNVGFPNTIQKVITSRIDRLSPAQQLTLKVSSVVGRVFGYQTVYDVYPVEADRPKLDSYIEQLETLAIIQLQQVEMSGLEGTAVQNGDRQYAFSNSMIQDIAYKLLLFEQRRQLHKAIGEWYERQETADLSRLDAILAHHWQQSDSPCRAVPYLARAGEEALKNGAYQDAISLFSRLIEIVENEPDEWQAVEAEISRETQLAIWHRQLGDSYSSLGETMLAIDHAKKALVLLGNPEPKTTAGLWLLILKGVFVQIAHRVWPGGFIGKRRNDSLLLERGRALMLTTEMYYFENYFWKSLHAGIYTLNYLEEAAPDSPYLFRILTNFVVGMGALPGNLFSSKFEQLAREALAGDDSIDATALFQFRLGILYFGNGRWEESIAMNQQAIENYRQLGHGRLLIESLTNLANTYYYRGLFDKLDGFGQEVYRLASRQGSVQQMVWGLNLLGMSRLKMADDPGQALTYLESSSELVGEQMAGIARAMYMGILPEVYLKMAADEQAKEAAEAVMAFLENSRILWAIMLQPYAAPALVYLTLWEKGDEDVSTRKPARAACRMLGRYAKVFVIGRPRSYLYWGWYHWLSDRRWVARYYWRRSLSEAVALDMPYEEALAHFELGRHSERDKDRIEHLETAAAIFERLEARYDLLKCRELMEGGG